MRIHGSRRDLAMSVLHARERPQFATLFTLQVALAVQAAKVAGILEAYS